MRTRLAVWAASGLFLHGGFAGLEPQWPTVAVSTQAHANASNLGVTVALAAQRTPFEHPLETGGLPLGELIRKVPICIIGSESWAGTLGDTLLFRVHDVGRATVSVGYFAYWSTERPWGNNSLTHWFVPALAIDAFYSHLLFVLPGIQRLLYGPGDVEGVRIKYEIRKATQLVPISIVADNEQHREEVIEVSEAVDEAGRILLSDEVWSHQLGGHNAVTLARRGAKHRCFAQGALQKLTDDIAAAFRLGNRSDPRRAGPAWGTHTALFGAPNGTR